APQLPIPVLPPGLPPVSAAPPSALVSNGGGPGGGGPPPPGPTELCGACVRPICDRYIMRVADASYHERCLLCNECGTRLAHKCYTRDSKFYCRLDYDRLYVKKCLGCGERVSADELVLRALDSVFHVRCFVCVVCGGRLQKGDQFVVKQGQLFCRPDYEKEVEMLQGYAQGDFTCEDGLLSAGGGLGGPGGGPRGCVGPGGMGGPGGGGPGGLGQDGRRGPKRPRTILTTQQRRAFKASFEVSPKPCRKVREALAKETGLSVRIVQVWFQNQRAKMKKIQKKARQDGKSKESDNDDKSLKNKMKEEENSPPASSFLNNDSSDTEGGGSGSILTAGSVVVAGGPGRADSVAFELREAVVGVDGRGGPQGGGGGPPQQPPQIPPPPGGMALPPHPLAHHHALHIHPHLHPNHHHHHFLPLKEEMEGEGGPPLFFKPTPPTTAASTPSSQEFDTGGHGDKMDTAFIGFPYSASPLDPPNHVFVHQPPSLNPIDRLYSMQTSYFCGEEGAMADQ
ncbi:LIM homeobox transcription factor 1-alpha-like, partial [Ischnura elegans]|uniref:LIM homeobox transcription factor 1-alpha-like n=1 Tax=Ischnura elegans TaxID=197161 RepID=UPI001ED8872C